MPSGARNLPYEISLGAQKRDLVQVTFCNFPYCAVHHKLMGVEWDSQDPPACLTNLL